MVDIEGKGRGVVSTQPFSKGELVCEYSGDLIFLEEARKREQKYAKDPTIGCYMYYFSYKNRKMWYVLYNKNFLMCVPELMFFSLDATVDNGRMGRLLNHSRTAPNVVTRLVEVDKKPYLCLMAARDILIGEELQYDYGERNRPAIDSHPWLKN